MAEDIQPGEYRQGEMDITEHRKMFEKFVKFWIYQAAAIIAILIFLALFNS